MYAHHLLWVNRPPFHIQLKKLTNSSHFWQPCMSYTSVPVGQCDKRQVCRLLGSYYYTTTHISSYMHNWEGAPYPLKDFNYAKGSFLKRRHLWLCYSVTRNGEKRMANWRIVWKLKNLLTLRFEVKSYCDMLRA